MVSLLLESAEDKRRKIIGDNEKAQCERRNHGKRSGQAVRVNLA